MLPVLRRLPSRRLRGAVRPGVHVRMLVHAVLLGAEADPGRWCSHRARIADHGPRVRRSEPTVARLDNGVRTSTSEPPAGPRDEAAPRDRRVVVRGRTRRLDASGRPFLVVSPQRTCMALPANRPLIESQAFLSLFFLVFVEVVSFRSTVNTVEVKLLSYCFIDNVPE